MYLDIDIILALIKDEDWLKKYIKFKEIKNPKTSVLTIVEARLVLLREYSRFKSFDGFFKRKNFKIEILDINQTIIEKSQELIEKYSNLNMFDSIQAASAILANEKIMSTDPIYDSINELEKMDPRKTI